MNIAARMKRPLIFLAAAAFLGGAMPASAQEVSESHLAAARAAMTALGATRPFDTIILELADQLKRQLYQKNPDMEEVISDVVDEVAIGLASRRSDLERESALVYASGFSEQELNEIASFYASETGKKMISQTPIIARELLNRAEIWRLGISRDLGQQVGTKLGEYARENPPQAAE